MSTEDQLQKVLDWMIKATDNELEALISLAHAEHRTREERSARLKTLNFKQGDAVKNLKGSRKLPLGAHGTVIRVANTTVIVNFSEFGKWRIAAALIEKV